MRTRKLIRSWRSKRSAMRRSASCGVVGVVAAGHLGDVGLGSRLIADGRHHAGQADPAVAVARIDDRQADARVAQEVRRPAPADLAVEHDLVAVESIPDHGLPRSAVRVDRRDARELRLGDEVADAWGEREGGRGVGHRAMVRGMDAGRRSRSVEVAGRGVGAAEMATPSERIIEGARRSATRPGVRGPAVRWFVSRSPPMPP